MVQRIVIFEIPTTAKVWFMIGIKLSKECLEKKLAIRPCQHPFANGILLLAAPITLVF